MNYSKDEFVTLSFGTTGGPGSSGGSGTLIEDIEPSPDQAGEKVKLLIKVLKLKEVALPKAQPIEKENIIKQADKDKELSVSSSTEAKG